MVLRFPVMESQQPSTPALEALKKQAERVKDEMREQAQRNAEQRFEWGYILPSDTDVIRTPTTDVLLPKGTTYDYTDSAGATTRNFVVLATPKGSFGKKIIGPRALKKQMEKIYLGQGQLHIVTRP
jgi:hypothetical protein